MKNIKLGNNIYENVEQICLKDENGNIVTFVDGSIYNDKYVSAHFTDVKLGFTVPTVISKTVKYPQISAYGNAVLK